MQKNRLPLELIIAGLAAMVFVPFLGHTHLFDWDEINFAESAREMLVSGEYTFVQINFEPFWEKPPLFIWMQLLSMKLWGVGELGARFPNAICGIMTLLSLFWIGKWEIDKDFGWMWSLAYGCSILPQLYFKSGIIDPWFNLFILLGIYFGYRWLAKEEGSMRNALFCGVFTGLSMLTKGPVGPLLVGLPGLIYLIFQRKEIQSIKFGHVLGALSGFILFGGVWFFLQMISGRWDVLVDFFVYQIRLFQTQDAGHGGFFGYHVVVLLLGVFPLSILALRDLVKKAQHKEVFSLHRLMQITFWVVLILFSIVRTKIVHYSSMAYFPLTFLGTWHLYLCWKKERETTRWQFGMLLFIGALLGLAVSALAFAPDIQEYLRTSDLLDDPFARANLEAEVQWRGYEFLPGVLLLAGVLGALWKRKVQGFRSLLLILLSTALFTFLTTIWVVPRIEMISQQAAIEFFESKSREDCYLASLNYKSYAPYFYGKVPPNQPQEAKDKWWLMTGEIDKTVYFSSKIQYKERILQNYPDFEFLYGKNGFIFFVRQPNSSP